MSFTGLIVGGDNPPGFANPVDLRVGEVCSIYFSLFNQQSYRPAETYLAG